MRVKLHSLKGFYVNSIAPSKKRFETNSFWNKLATFNIIVFSAIVSFNVYEANLGIKYMVAGITMFAILFSYMYYLMSYITSKVLSDFGIRRNDAILAYGMSITPLIICYILSSIFNLNTGLLNSMFFISCVWSLFSLLSVLSIMAEEASVLRILVSISLSILFITVSFLFLFIAQDIFYSYFKRRKK